MRCEKIYFFNIIIPPITAPPMRRVGKIPPNCPVRFVRGERIVPKVP